MPVRIEYKASVEGDLKKLGSPQAALRLLGRIEKKLKESGDSGKHLAGAFKGLYRVRVGDYRAIYARTDDGYLVLRISHRRDVYQRGRP